MFSFFTFFATRAWLPLGKKTKNWVFNSEESCNKYSGCVWGDIQVVQGDQELQGRQRNRYMCTQGQGSSPHLSYTDTIIKILSEQIYTALRKVLSMLHHHLVKKNHDSYMIFLWNNKGWRKVNVNISTLTTPGRSQQVSSEAHVVLQTISKDCSWNWKWWRAQNRHWIQDRGSDHPQFLKVCLECINRLS